MFFFRYFLIGLAACLFLAYVILGLNIDLTPISYIFVLLVNIYMVICSRRNFMLFIISFILFFSNYSIIYANYANTIHSMFTVPLSVASFNISFNILTLFNSFLLLFVRWNYITTGLFKNTFVKIEQKDSFILLFLSALLIPIFFWGFTIPDIEGQRGSPSPIYEYSSILFILFFYYCGLNKWYVRLGLLFVFFYSVQSMIFGGRIEAIQFILVAYIMLFMHKISMRKIVIAMGFMFVVLSVVGVVRGALLSGDVDVLSILSVLGERGLALDTAYSAYYTSESFVYVLDKYTSQEIFMFFLQFLKYIFIGGDSEILLTNVSLTYVDHYMGGILPFYFYFYLGVFGVLLSALIVSFYIKIVNDLNDNTSGYIKCLIVWVVCTTFRWYLYTPLPLLRGVIFLTIAYFGLSYLHCQLNRLPLRNRSLYQK